MRSLADPLVALEQHSNASIADKARDLRVRILSKDSTWAGPINGEQSERASLVHMMVFAHFAYVSIHVDVMGNRERGLS